MDYDKILAKATGASGSAADPTANLDYDAILGKLTEPEGPTIGQRALGALPLGSDFSEGYNDAINRSTGRMSEAAKDIGEHGFGPMNMGSMALGAIDYVASPFSGVGRFISNPIRRVGAGIPGIGIAADTAELAPMMAAPMPGAKTMEGLTAGAGAVMGEGPAAMAALNNTMAMLKSMVKGAPRAAPSAPETLPSQMEAGQTARTSHQPFPTGWYEKQFSGGSVPPPNMVVPNVEQAGQVVAREGKKDSLVLSDKYVNRGERPTYRTSTPAPTARDDAPIDYFNEAVSNPDNVSSMYMPQMGSEAMPGGLPENVEAMRLPNIRNQPFDPSTEKQVGLDFRRNRMTSPMQSRLTPQPLPPEEDPSVMYGRFFNKDMSPSKSMAQAPITNATPMPTEQPSIPTRPPRTRMDATGEPMEISGGSSGGQKVGPYTIAPISNRDYYWDDKDPAGFGTPDIYGGKPRPGTTEPQAKKPVPRVTSKAVLPREAPPADALQFKLKSFKGGPVAPNEVPPLAQDRPTQPWYDPSDPTGSKPNPTMNTGLDVGTSVDLVHNVGGQEMRIPGGKIVGTISKNEPVYGKPTRDAKGNMVSGMSTKPVDYVILEDGREVPRSIVQPAAAPVEPKKTSVSPNAPTATQDSKELMHQIQQTKQARPTLRKQVRDATKAGDAEQLADANRRLDDNYREEAELVSKYSKAGNYAEADVEHAQKSATAIKFSVLSETNNPFHKYIQGKPFDTDAEKEALINEFFPKTRQNLNKQLSTSYKKQNAEPSTLDPETTTTLKANQDKNMATSVETSQAKDPEFQRMKAGTAKFPEFLKELPFKPNLYKTWAADNNVGVKTFKRLVKQAKEAGYLIEKEGRLWRTHKDLPED